MSTPDGWPIAAALRLLAGRRDQQRVTGSDLTPLLCQRVYMSANNGLCQGVGQTASTFDPRFQAGQPAPAGWLVGT